MGWQSGSAPCACGACLPMSAARVDQQAPSCSVQLSQSPRMSCTLIIIVTHIFHLPSASVQYKNQMEGTLPQDLGLPEGMLSLRVGSNNLTGPLPALKLPSTLQRCVALATSCGFFM